MSNIPTNLIIRRARDGDLPQMAYIHRSSFPEVHLTLDQTLEHLRNTPRLAMEDNWICENGSEILGMFALYNLEMYLGGRTFPTGGIGRVAVSPQARGQKIAYWMMQRCIEIMDQNSTPFSMLHPFEHGFYNYLGWGNIGSISTYKFNPGMLPDSSARENVTLVSRYDQQENVMACYRNYAASNNCLIERDDQTWIEQVFKNHFTYSFTNPNNGEVEGYIVFRYAPLPENTTPMESDILIREMVWNSRSSFTGLIAFLRAQKDQVRSIVYNDQSGIPFEFITANPRAKGGRQNMISGAEIATQGSGIMGRIVQLKRALKVPGLFGNGRGKIQFKIYDRLSAQNSEQLTVEFENGEAVFSAKSMSELTVNTDMATFSSLYFGSLDIKNAVYLNLVEFDGKGDASFLADVFPRVKPVCLDYF